MKKNNMKTKRAFIKIGDTSNVEIWKGDLMCALEKYGINYLDASVYADEYGVVPLPKNKEKGQLIETKTKKDCDYFLYVFAFETNFDMAVDMPEIVEAIYRINKSPKKTIFHLYLKEGCISNPSILETKKIIKKNGGLVFNSLQRVALYIKKGMGI